MEKSRKKGPENDESGEDYAVDANGHSVLEPLNKVAKLTHNTDIGLNLQLNKGYLTKELTLKVQESWTSKHITDYREKSTGIEIYSDPYQLCLLPEFLQNTEACRALVDEMVDKVRWSRKQMDLYEFYQSMDLSNLAECKLLNNFLQLLRREVRPWLEQITQLKLDYVSASCSMYTCGDYLLVHDDLLKDRQIAFIYYLSPWDGAKQWNEEQGGCLEIFNSDDQCYPQFPVRRKISPKNNQFAFFKVGARSFHQVGEVTTFDYPRLTINGWFHGASNDDDVLTESLRPFARTVFKPPTIEKCSLETLLHEVYLKPATRKSIQKRIEDNSEICLYEFFKRDVFDTALSELQNDKGLIWRQQGPANAQNFDVLELSSASKTIDSMVKLFGCFKMFELLRDFTDLDLSGPDVVTPSCSVEVQRWSHANYTVLGDGAICDENSLDLIYYLNASEGAAVITYLSPEAEQQQQRQMSKSTCSNSEEEDDESVLLTITPVDNSLNIVYRCEGTTKFTKYISRNTPMEKGPTYLISCSYKE